MTEKDRLHGLVDRLLEHELRVAERALTGLSAPPLSDLVATALAAAPEDDEPVMDREAELIEEGERDLRSGRTWTAGEVHARFGL